MLWWNGSPLPVPIAPMQYSYRDIEGTNSGQTLGGSYSKKVIARKEDLLVQWAALSPEEAAAVADLKKSTFGRLTYYSPQAGKFVTKTMYTEDLTAELTDARVTDTTLQYGDFSSTVQFKEK